MAAFLFLLFVFSNAFLHSAVVGSAQSPISLSPEENRAKPPSSRKLGKHSNKTIVYSSLSPAEAPCGEGKVVATAEFNGGENEIHLEKQKHHHKSRDKSIAGGGVILGGLAATFLVAIVCYIRVTRRQI